MNINEMRDKEVAHWKGKFERTVRLCRAILVWGDYIQLIKRGLYAGDVIGASQLWHELDYPVQKLLITAPRYGGPFTTEEVKQIKELWEISADDMEGK